MASSRKRIGELLAEAGAIDAMQLQAALGYQRQWGGKLGAVLVERGFIAEARLVEVLAGQLGVPVVQIAKARVDPRAVAIVPAALCEQLRVFPLELRGPDKSEVLIAAMSDPTDLAAIDQLQFRTRKRVQSVLAGDRDIGTAIRRYYHNEEIAAPPEPEPVAPRPKPLSDDEFFRDMHMLGSDVDSDRVPGLVGWGEGELKGRPAAPAMVQSVQPAYAPPPYLPPQPAASSGVVVPAGIPPGFIPPPRGRPMLAPAGVPAGRPLSLPPGQPRGQPHGAALGRSHQGGDIDPFEDIDPLQGVDPVGRGPARGRPASTAFDLSAPEDMPGDNWESAIEPVGPGLSDSDPLGGPVDMFGGEEPVAGEELEELDVDINIQEVTGTRSRSSQRLEISSPIDAAAEGWLTPTEEAAGNDAGADAWATPSEGGENDWASIAPDARAAEAVAATDAWSDEQPIESRAPAAEIAPIELPEDSAPPEGEWFEPGRHEEAADTSTGVESWLEPIAATIGTEQVEQPVEGDSLELATVDAPAEGGAPPAPADWAEQGWSDDAAGQTAAAPVPGWDSPAEELASAAGVDSAAPAAEAGGWDTPTESPDAAPWAATHIEAADETAIQVDDDAVSEAIDETVDETIGEATTRISIDGNLSLSDDPEAALAAAEPASHEHDASTTARTEIDTPWNGSTIQDFVPAGGFPVGDTATHEGTEAHADGAAPEEAAAADWGTPIESHEAVGDQPASLESSEDASAWGTLAPEAAEGTAAEGTAAEETAAEGTAAEGTAAEGTAAEWGASASSSDEAPLSGDWGTASEAIADATGEAQAEAVPVIADGDWSEPVGESHEALGWADPEGTVPISISPHAEVPEPLVADPSDAASDAAAWAEAAPPPVEDEASGVSHLATPFVASPEPESTSAFAWAEGQPESEPITHEAFVEAPSDGSAAAWALSVEEPGVTSAAGQDAEALQAGGELTTRVERKPESTAPIVELAAGSLAAQPPAAPVAAHSSPEPELALGAGAVEADAFSAPHETSAAPVEETLADAFATPLEAEVATPPAVEEPVAAEGAAPLESGAATEAVSEIPHGEPTLPATAAAPTTEVAAAEEWATPVEAVAAADAPGDHVSSDASGPPAVERLPDAASVLESTEALPAAAAPIEAAAPPGGGAALEAVAEDLAPAVADASVEAHPPSETPEAAGNDAAPAHPWGAEAVAELSRHDATEHLAEPFPTESAEAVQILDEEGVEVSDTELATEAAAQAPDAATIPGGEQLRDAAHEAIALAAAAATLEALAQSQAEAPAPVAATLHEVAAEPDAAATVAIESAGTLEPVPPAAESPPPAAWPPEHGAVSLPFEHRAPLADVVATGDEWAGFGGVSAPPDAAVPPVEVEAAAHEPTLAAASVAPHHAAPEPSPEASLTVSPAVAGAGDVVVSPSLHLPDETALVELESVRLDSIPGSKPEAVAAAVAVGPSPAPDAAAPGSQGWNMLGIANPTANDAVHVMGALVELLVARGAVTPADLADALRKVREQMNKAAE